MPRASSVNASPADFESAVTDLTRASVEYPGWLDRLLTNPIDGLDNYQQMLRELTESADAIKVFVQVSPRDAGRAQRTGKVSVGA